MCESKYPVQVLSRSSHFGVHIIVRAEEATLLRFTLISVNPPQDNGIAKLNAMANLQQTKTLVSETFDNCMSSACLSLDST